MKPAAITAMHGTALEAAEHALVRHVMTRDPVSVRPEMTIRSLVDLFREEGLSRVPVVDGERRPIGMIAKTDVVFDRGTSTFVRDVMTPFVLALPETVSVADAARRMLAARVHSVPVNDVAGQLVGVLSAVDIVAWVAGTRYAGSPR